MKTKKLLGEYGFTLIEIMFVGLIFPMIALSLFSILRVSLDSFYSGDIYYHLNQQCMQSLRTITREISQTSPLVSPSHLNITTDGNGDSIVRFQIPVDWDNDGDIVTSNVSPSVEWGAYDEVGVHSDGRLAGWVQYIVMTDNELGKQLKRRILDSTYTAVDGLDQVIASNVQSFSVEQDSSTVTVTLTLQDTDPVRSRTFNASFSSDTLLRNAVS